MEFVKKPKQSYPVKILVLLFQKEAQMRIENYISEAEEQGAVILVDGRGTTVKNKENGFYVGPTVIDRVTPI